MHDVQVCGVYEVCPLVDVVMHLSVVACVEDDTPNNPS